VTEVRGATAADEPQTHLRQASATGSVRVEIEATTLLKLLEERRICGSDMRCLDCESKSCLWRLLLAACARGLGRGDG